VKYYVVAAAALALAAACEGSASKSADSPKMAAPQAAPAAATGAMPAMASSAMVMITSPAEGDTTGPDVTVKLSAMGVIVEKAGTKVEGHGHHHLFLDMSPSAEGAPIPPNSAMVQHIGTGDSTWTFKGLTPGPHTLIAVLAYGDHVPMTNVARDTVHFVVKK
jgi:hypothetical protein